MSNDAKYWGYRILNYALFTIDGWFLTNAIMGGFATNKGNNHTALWFVLTGIAIAANVPVYIAYRHAKRDRWGSTPKKTQQELDVEILAAYGAQQQAEKDAAAAHKPPTAPIPPTMPTPPPVSPQTPPPAPPIPPAPTA